jgi:predicted transposase YbfD/YdcC
MKENTNTALASFDKYFGQLEDSRDKRGFRHHLRDILAITILAVICGADEFTEIEEYGKSKQEFLATFLDLPNGIPSHDTFGRVFGALDPDKFRTCFVAWVKSLCDIHGDIVNIDGKALRRSYDTASDKPMIHMVSAWANKNNLVLGQVKVSEKSNEITAIPKLLEILDLAGSIVTIDAMGTQKAIAARIVDKEADYLLALKGNQGNLQQEVEEAFNTFEAKDKAVIDQNIQLGHGRIEERNCYVVPAKDYISPNVLSCWKNLASIIKIEAYVTYKNGKNKGKQTYEERYYISSLPQHATKINHAVQSHWGIETKVHWVLDVAFREDDTRVRSGHADENLAIVRHIALNKLKNETSCKRGIKAKRKKAGWNQKYLLKVLKT